MLLALLLLFFGPSVAAWGQADAKAPESKPTDEGVQAAERLSQSFRSIAQAVRPSVVGISTAQPFTPAMGLGGERDPLAEMLREFFGEEYFGRFFLNRRPGQAIPYPQGSEQRFGQGSGVIVSADGYILTNHHIVAKAEEVSVKLHDGKTLKAKVLGSDRKSDLALLKVEAKDLKPARLGDSDKVQLCDWVLAVGSPYRLDQTVVHGLISARGKGKKPAVAYEEFFQTDAPIQPANSGGPLLNLRGEVIGISTALFSGQTGGQAVNFAIPINLAKKVMDGLKKEGRVARGWLGVAVQNLTPDLARSFGLEGQAKGVLVSHVEPGSPAEKGGLKGGDVIVRFGDKDVAEAQALRELVADTKVGTEVKLQILRDGKEQALAVRVGEARPSSPAPRVPTAKSSTDGTAHPFGFTVQELTPELAKRYGHTEAKGVIISEVQPGSIAYLGGLRPGALVVEANRKKVGSVTEFQEALKEAREPNTLLLLLRYDQVTQFVFLKKE
jgi:serine protease Do